MPKIASVLLVDDDPTTNFLNRLLLKKMAVADHLLVAENGREALAVLARACPPAGPDCPALILLDVNMPVMGGIEFLEAYQQLPPAQCGATVIVMLTTSVHPRDLARLAALPIAGVVSKPLTREKMADILARHFA